MKSLQSLTVSKSLFAASAALLISVTALIIAICKSSPSTLAEPFAFSKNPAKTAKCIFDKKILTRAFNPGQEGYFWNKFGEDAIDNAEYAVEQNGQNAVVFVETSVNGQTLTDIYFLKKNNDGFYTVSFDNSMPDADLKWKIKIREKASEHLRKNQRIDTDKL